MLSAQTVSGTLRGRAILSALYSVLADFASPSSVQCTRRHTHMPRSKVKFTSSLVVVYYCRNYYKDVQYHVIQSCARGGRGIVD